MRSTIERPPEEPLAAVCDRFRRLRKAARLSPAEVARRTGMNYREVLKFETGARRPQRHHLELLERAVTNGRSR